MYHSHNMEEIMYFIQGEGLISSGNSTWRVGVEDAAYIPTGVAHSIRSTIKNQPITFVSYTLPTPPDAKEATVEKAPKGKQGGKVLVRRWTTRESRPGHNGTCWTYGVFEKKDMLNFLFAVMMTVPGTLGYHRHNTEAIYFVRSGRGMMKVGGEELEIRAGDAVYIPFEVAHRPRTTVEDQPLNVFCVGVAIPHDAEVWSLEDLPDL
jgi:mannose-6-phosphate isomerase-like protein (cupin superfamily)